MYIGSYEDVVRAVDELNKSLKNMDVSAREVALHLERVVSALAPEMPLDTKFNNPTWQKASVGEPLFIIRAQDASAPLMPILWLERNSHLLYTKSAQYAAKVAAVFRSVEIIRNWQTENKTKSAD